MDLILGTMHWDERCRTLFGISHHNKVTYEKDFITGLHPEDKDRIIDIINDAFVKSRTGGNYDVEYRTIGAEDQKLRWVRAKGQVYFDKNEAPVRFIGSVLDITEQKQDEQRKNDFIGMVSHELKTPLTSLNAYLQMLQSKAKGNEDSFTTGALDQSVRQVRKMTTMINGFLNVSRLENAKINIDRRRFELSDLVREVEVEITVMNSGHKFIFEPVLPTFVDADRDKIGQVMTNFISNAVKYSKPRSTVQVACVIENNDARFSVRDEGMGIKPEDKERLFERYYRVENAGHISGFGIGLYLCAEIISRHGGKIWLESETGQGSTFYFSLPVVQ
jgi:two-component system sensor histidine kinase VicK